MFWGCLICHHMAINPLNLDSARAKGNSETMLSGHVTGLDLNTLPGKWDGCVSQAGEAPKHLPLARLSHSLLHCNDWSLS
jgi:hypothetical protein